MYVCVCVCVYFQVYMKYVSFEICYDLMKYG